MQGGLGLAYRILALLIPELPDTIDPFFSLSGPTSGNGLPLGLTLGVKGAFELTLIFCDSGDDW